MYWDYQIIMIFHPTLSVYTIYPIIWVVETSWNLNYLILYMPPKKDNKKEVKYLYIKR